jgi:hypothetical protein
MLRTAALKAESRFSMPVVPNDGRHRSNSEFGTSQENHDLYLFALLEYGWSVQGNATAAYVDAGALEMCLRI